MCVEDRKEDERRPGEKNIREFKPDLLHFHILPSTIIIVKFSFSASRT
jgi:hypothetical protein